MLAFDGLVQAAVRLRLHLVVAVGGTYEPMYGKAPKHMSAAFVLRACENVLGLPGDVDWEERMAGVELLKEQRKSLGRVSPEKGETPHW